jgi:RHH-type proline utilization regulon transcriptional repressor/proline dehydrogenase/delta 1-pyrroline-5-carboxylate dehydrogenase
VNDKTPARSPTRTDDRASTRAHDLLRQVRGKPLDRATRVERTVELATALLALSRQHTHGEDRRRARMLGRMMRDPAGQQLTTALTDRLYRSHDSARVVDEVAHLLRVHGAPRFMRLHERAGLLGVRALAPLHAPGLTPLMARSIAARVRGEARQVLLDAEERALSAHLARRHREGVRVNLLGEREAAQRVDKYVALAERDGIDALSVKVSSISSQLNLLAFDTTLATVSERLARIYRATLAYGRERERTLVMLDMEAYQHVELTLEALFRTLSDPALDRVRAGVVLQAYLPDSQGLLTRLSRYAAARVERGGMPLRLRIVKGANLAHERVESARSGATVPVFADKSQVDASYKRLLEQALTPSSTRSLQVGVASHNLFDLSYALLLRAEGDLDRDVELELLEGMAEPVCRALRTLGVGLLLYAPVCKDEELNSGIAYLVRRLDENTAPENYLRQSFAMTPTSRELVLEKQRFLRSMERMDGLSTRPRREHDEGFDRSRPQQRSWYREFTGAADTDFSLATNRGWAAEALARCRQADAPRLRSCIAGRDVDGPLRDGVDPSRPGVVPYRVALADDAAIADALACAAADPLAYSQRSLDERAQLLGRCAAALRGARAELIATMVLDGGKRVSEADVEVSEAIDFAEYYRTSFPALLREHRVSASPRGVVLVTPPWNFPLAIPAGGIFAALMAGCRVLFKPAMETALVGARLAELLYAAGVPREALQLVLCDDEVASALVRDPRVSSVVLTGATSTAQLFQRLRPGLSLLAETGGKNAYIVSAMSDRELAIRDVLASAFGHAGQKCSATSLLICEDEVYDDVHFRSTLRDAVESLPVGSSWAPESFVTPLIRPPEAGLARALSTLEPGETWLVEPRIAPDNPCLVSPGVKLGVRSGSFTHTTELFGPVLGVMRARSLAHAVQLANATGYGLTAGLASLDEREQAYFCEHLEAGNLYVNRTTTGAIVRRQPFGGVGTSGFGPGAKAGGPNYVAQLCHLRELPHAPPPAPRLEERVLARVLLFEQKLSTDEALVLRQRAHDFTEVQREHFAREHDPEQVLGQHNRFRYRPCRDVLLRVEADAAPLDIATSCLAAELAGVWLQVSIAAEASAFQDASLLGHPLTVESLAALVARKPRASRIRVLGTRSTLHDQLNLELGAHIADAPVLGVGRFELLHYLHEQSVSIDYHRYGHVPQPAK